MRGILSILFPQHLFTIDSIQAAAILKLKSEAGVANAAPTHEVCKIQSACVVLCAASALSHPSLAVFQKIAKMQANRAYYMYPP